MKIAVIGAGISGLSVAHFLKNNNISVTIFEKESTPGGLIRCKRIDGNLFHICGGHVFNSKRTDILDWFWNRFNREVDFHKTDRNACVVMDNKTVAYPIENNFYCFDEETQKNIISDLVSICRNKEIQPLNFKDFLINTFGQTLYEKYFRPYNEKIWQSDLSKIPLSWLEGKLPTPSISEIIFNNINRIAEKQTVHSSFWYEKNNGSQFIADQLSKNLDVRYNSETMEMHFDGKKWKIANEEFDKVVFCGNIKDLPRITKGNGVDFDGYVSEIEKLQYHGTTAVFCEIDKNPYSWIYLPDQSLKCHRIICTGNFAASNNADGKMTGTVEFTDEVCIDEIKENLLRTPFHPRYIVHHFNKYTYPIQNPKTRQMIVALKKILSKSNLFFTGRFADWEYYNMDVAMAAAKRTVEEINSYNTIK